MKLNIIILQIMLHKGGGEGSGSGNNGLRLNCQQENFKLNTFILILSEKYKMFKNDVAQKSVNEVQEMPLIELSVGWKFENQHF